MTYEEFRDKTKLALNDDQAKSIWDTFTNEFDGLLDKCTCLDCAERNDLCQWAFDGYNIDGDCLLLK